MQLRLQVLLLLGFCALQFANANTLRIGANYDQVIAALGEPDGELNAGSRQILTYGKAQIKLQNGKVNSISPELNKLLDQRANDQAAIDAKRSAGLVNYKGKWIRESEYTALIARESERAKAAAPQAQPSTGWMTNFEQAKAVAKAENKKLLLNFTGSDWCGWCIKLDQEVFSQKAFLDYAKNNYVLVKLDFPRRFQLPAQLKQQNEALAKKYKVRGFPTVVVLKPNGRKHANSGYVRGGPEAFIRSLK